MRLSCYYFYIISFFLGSGFLSGCMLGPDFHSPRAPLTRKYTALPFPKHTKTIPGLGKSGISQTFEYKKSMPPTWWIAFGSKEMNDLLCMGLASSPNLESAKAALVVAQENLNAEIGSKVWPNIDFSFSAVRQRTSADIIGTGGAGKVFTLFNTSLAFTSYTLDFFGALRRQIEAVHAKMDERFFELRAVYLTLTANIVTTAITIASLQEQIETTHQLISDQEKQLFIIKHQFEVGGATRANIYSQESEIARLRATLPPLAQRLARNQHALAVLIGKPPGNVYFPPLNLHKLILPKKLPLLLPSTLVRQRPDILASEALLHEASAQIGVTTANLFPQISLQGSFGAQSLAFHRLFKASNSAWSLGPTLLQPVFHGGALLAERRGAIANYRGMLMQYRQKVLEAFQNVADVLRALQHDAETLKAEREAEMAAYRALNLIKEQFRLGGVNYLDLLNANRTYQQAKLSRIQAEAARYIDTAALFQALGGGW